MYLPNKQVFELRKYITRKKLKNGLPSLFESKREKDIIVKKTLANKVNVVLKLYIRLERFI